MIARLILIAALCFANQGCALGMAWCMENRMDHKQPLFCRW